jgi:hypothetical protein
MEPTIRSVEVRDFAAARIADDQREWHAQVASLSRSQRLRMSLGRVFGKAPLPREGGTDPARSSQQRAEAPLPASA